MWLRARALVMAAVAACLPAFASAAELDPFGVSKLNPTVKGGREWYADWKAARSVQPSRTDPQDPLLRNSDGILAIRNGAATLPAARSRLFVLTPKNKAGDYALPQWQNVEMTIYVKCDAPTQSVPGQALTLSARSGERHSDNAPCDGTSYHASVRFDGQCGFKKEIWHTGGYTELRPSRAPRPWNSPPLGRWIGIKFVCRNIDQDRHVKLQLYLDLQERNDWNLIAELTDAGGWEGQRQGCERAKDEIITEARPAVYFRTDFVPVELKRFSVREIEPLR